MKLLLKSIPELLYPFHKRYTEQLPWIWRLIHEFMVIGTLYYWIQSICVHQRYPGGDGPHILGTSGRLAQLLKDGEFEWFVYCFSSLLGPHPPFAYLPFVASAFVSPEIPYNHLMGGAIVLWLIADAMYRLRAGVFGFAFIWVWTPIWLQSENAGIDLVAAATVLQSISHLVRSNSLEDRYHTFGWGAWIGAAFMTKYTAPMFLWAPCLVAGIWAIKHKRMKRILQGVGAFCVVALPWWSTHWKQVQGYVLASGNAQSGLLTNKTIIEDPWTVENMLWYPTAMMDTVGPWLPITIVLGVLLCSIRLVNIRSWAGPVLISSILGGWLMLNAQKQRQDRYILPAYPIMSAGLVMAPSLITVAALPFIWQVTKENISLFNSNTPAPAQRDYSHDVATPARTYPTPHEAYWPISHDLAPWNIDSALEKIARIQGPDGTVGFLLDEQGGAPGYGIVLSKAVQMGFNWHIATIMIARRGGPGPKDPNRPLASVFVGPFLFGEWPSREFEVMLSMVKHDDPQREKWIQSTNMVVVDEWTLPMDRVGRIYIHPDLVEEYKRGISE